MLLARLILSSDLKCPRFHLVSLRCLHQIGALLDVVASHSLTTGLVLHPLTDRTARRIILSRTDAEPRGWALDGSFHLGLGLAQRCRELEDANEVLILKLFMSVCHLVQELD